MRFSGISSSHLRVSQVGTPFRIIIEGTIERVFATAQIIQPASIRVIKFDFYNVIQVSLEYHPLSTLILSLVD